MEENNLMLKEVTNNQKKALEMLIKVNDNLKEIVDILKDRDNE